MKPHVFPAKIAITILVWEVKLYGQRKKAKEHKFLNKHTVLGVFLGAVYIRTGNIWPIILGHSLHDIMAFSASEKLSMLGMNLPDWSVTLLTVVEAGLLRGNVEIPGVDLSKPDPLFR